MLLTREKWTNYILVSLICFTWNSRPASGQTANETTGERRFTTQLRQPTDLPLESAAGKALRILKLIGHSTGMAPAPASSRITFDVFSRRIWEFKHAEYLVALDSKTGELLRYKNYLREREQLSGAGRNREYVVRSQAQGRALMWKYANTIGLPGGGVFLVDFEFHKENDARVPGSNRAGHIWGHFTSLGPGGHPYHDRDAVGVGIDVDPIDGVLMEYNQEWRVTARSAVAKLSSSAAVQIATDLYRGYLIMASSGGDLQPIPGEAAFTRANYARLEYVIPNGSHLIDGRLVQGVRPLEYPRTAILAWVVHFGIDELWIDAETGKLVGTEIISKRPQ